MALFLAALPGDDEVGFERDNAFEIAPRVAGDARNRLRRLRPSLSDCVFVLPKALCSLHRLPGG
jgi:hypothetical protein